MPASLSASVRFDSAMWLGISQHSLYALKQKFSKILH
jgi:hypothetical protein